MTFFSAPLGGLPGIGQSRTDGSASVERPESASESNRFEEHLERAANANDARRAEKREEALSTREQRHQPGAEHKPEQTTEMRGRDGREAKRANRSDKGGDRVSEHADDAAAHAAADSQQAEQQPEGVQLGGVMAQADAIWPQLAGQNPDGGNLEKLLVETLGARQGGGPMGQVNRVEAWVGQQTAATTAESAKEGGESGRGQGGTNSGTGLNGVGQRAAGQKVAMPRLTVRANAPDFQDELAGRIGRLRMISRPGIPDQVRITLDPRELGELRLRMSMDQDSRVHVAITAESEAAKELLNRQLSQLRAAFERQDMVLGEVTVEVGGQAGWEANAQWSHSENQAEPGFPGSRSSGQAGLSLEEGEPPPPPTAAIQDDGSVSLFA